MSSRRPCGITRALSLAAQGQHEDALRLAETAIDMIPAGMVNLCANVEVDLAETLRILGFEETAQHALDDAIDLYDRKGNLAASSRARVSMAIGDW